MSNPLVGMNLDPFQRFLFVPSLAVQCAIHAVRWRSQRLTTLCREQIPGLAELMAVHDASGWDRRYGGAVHEW